MQVSRAFGDAQFKPFGSSAVPDVTAFSISSKDKFMLCACDGFWGVSTHGLSAADSTSAHIQLSRIISCS